MNRRQRKIREQKRIKERGMNKENAYSCYLNFSSVFSYANLFNSANKCLRGVSWKSSVQRFSFNIGVNIKGIRDKLMDGSFTEAKARRFFLFERGKKRLIRSVSFRDRVVQRCLCDYCLEPILVNSFTYDNCASQKGKGTDFARKRFKLHMRQAYNKWGDDAYLVLYDIKSYFASIPTDKALSMLREKFESLVTDIVAHKSNIDKIIDVLTVFIHGNNGIELGNQVSQLVALFYLSPLDHYINEVLRFGLSGRYMDDGYVFVSNKEDAFIVVNEIDVFVAKLGLRLHPKKTIIQPITREAIFLKTGFKIDSGEGKIQTRVLSSVVRRNKRHIKSILTKIQQTPREDPKRDVLIESIKDSIVSFNGIATRASNKTSMRLSFRHWTETLKP